MKSCRIGPTAAKTNVVFSVIWLGLAVVLIGSSWIASASAQEKAESPILDEPVTSRPVANRFDFTNMSFTDLVAARGTARQTLPSERSVIVAQPAKGAKVAGWRQLKSVSASQPPENTVAVRVDPSEVLATRQLEGGSEVIATTESEAAASPPTNKLRRSRTSRAKAPDTQSQAPVSLAPGWERRALFPDS